MNQTQPLQWILFGHVEPPNCTPRTLRNVDRSSAVLIAVWQCCNRVIYKVSQLTVLKHAVLSGGFDQVFLYAQETSGLKGVW